MALFKDRTGSGRICCLIQIESKKGGNQDTVDIRKITDKRDGDDRWITKRIRLPAIWLIHLFSFVLIYSHLLSFILIHSHSFPLILIYCCLFSFVYSHLLLLELFRIPYGYFVLSLSPLPWNVVLVWLHLVNCFFFSFFILLSCLSFKSHGRWLERFSRAHRIAYFFLKSNCDFV